MLNQIEMPTMVRKYLQTSMLGEKIHEYTVKKFLGGGNTAVAYEVEDTNGVTWALKLVKLESYGDRAPFREVARFTQVEDERFLVFPKEVGDWKLVRANEAIDFVFFKSRCVKGITLREYLKSGTQFSVKTEVRRYIENLTVALEELWRLGFAHGDLHSGNVMREVVGEKGPIPEIRYVVIDFSEAHPVQKTQEGLLKDLECLGHHLQSFSDAIHQRDAISREDEKVLAAIAHFPGLLNGVTAESIGISRPSDILKRFDEGLRLAEEAPKKLATPFDALNAEDITNEALLAALCFTKNWWAPMLVKPGNILLVGPRGCGKSMIFRRLRLKTKIVAKKLNEIRSDSYVGFYLPCEVVFFNRIADLTDGMVELNRDALLLFFNMALTAEVASTIAAIPDFMGPISSGATDAIRGIVYEEIGDLWKELKFTNKLLSLHDVSDCAERVMRHIRKSIANGDAINSRGSTDYLTRLVEVVKREVPSLSTKLFIFFLDDYTEERVPIALQKNLHPIVCQRSGDLCFKISAHMFGSMYSFPQPLALDEGRNIRVINLGSEYLNRDRKKAEGKALIQIMNERFKRCDGYGDSIEGWLGKTSFPGGKSLNRALHDKDTRGLVKYHGIQCLIELCTGDISEMIRMVGEIFREAGIRKDSRFRQIDPSFQDKAIRNVSRDFLSRLRNIRPDGQKLYEVVNSFGSLSQQLLYERKLVGQGKDSKGQSRKDPCDLLTIYVDDLTRASQPARRVWERLQRASIFVDIRLAPSQRAVIADRVTLRRIYCPAFGTTLTSSEHLQATKGQFEWFMDRPEEFCKDYFRKVVKIGDEPTLWKEEYETKAEPEIRNHVMVNLPADFDRREFGNAAPERFEKMVNALPALQFAEKMIQEAANFDLYIGAMGFEERTSNGVAALLSRNAKVGKAFLLEFDMYYEATEKRRDKYEGFINRLTQGNPYRPINAPVGNPDPLFPERLKNALSAASAVYCPKIIFDCTSCPSPVLSKCLGVLLKYPCNLTILYSEAAKYYPSLDEWESGQLKAQGGRVEGPFSGIRFVEKPPSLQGDDIGERPVLLILFPTFNTERTSGVLAEIDPAKRIWLIGEPHDLTKNSYRIEMAKTFASPIMYPGDPWTLLTTFDYRKTMILLAGIYALHRFDHRFVVMPHGSKMQTLGVSLFATAHQLSMVFAMPKVYKPDRYSEGCERVWAIPLGNTHDLLKTIKSTRALGNGNLNAAAVKLHA